MTSDPENEWSGTGGLPQQEFTSPSHEPPPPPREIWGLRDLLLFVVFVPFGLLVSKVLVLIAYSVLRPLAGWHEKVEVAQSGTIFLLVEQCLFYILIIGLLFLLARIRHGQPFWRSLGWKEPTAKQVAVCLAAGAALAIVASIGLSIHPDTKAFPLEKLFNSRTAAYALGVFAVSVAPVVEELVFRGLLFAIFDRAVGWVFAIVTTAVLFAGLHIPEYWPAWNHIAMILVVGLVLSLSRGLSGNLAPSILLHIGYNSLIILDLFFSTQHFRTASVYAFL